MTFQVGTLEQLVTAPSSPIPHAARIAANSHHLLQPHRQPALASDSASRSSNRIHTYKHALPPPRPHVNTTAPQCHRMAQLPNSLFICYRPGYNCYELLASSPFLNNSNTFLTPAHDFASLPSGKLNSLSPRRPWSPSAKKGQVHCLTSHSTHRKTPPDPFSAVVPAVTV
jgi:hypothetical protein